MTFQMCSQMAFPNRYTVALNFLDKVGFCQHHHYHPGSQSSKPPPVRKSDFSDPRSWDSNPGSWGSFERVGHGS